MGGRAFALRTCSIDVDRVAGVIAEVAQELILPRWRRLGSDDIIEKSGPADMVTIADREAEAALSIRLPALLPGSAVVGEEGVHADRRRLGLLAGEAPVWVVDPVDGTAAFVAGEPEFTVMVALVIAGETVAGWIHAPADGETYLGARGEGVRRRTPSGEAALPSLAERPPPKAMTGIVGRSALGPERQAALLAREPRLAGFRPAVYAGREYPRLFERAADFAFFARSEPWDHLPGLALARILGFEGMKGDGTAYRPGDNSGGLIVAPRDGLEALRQILIQA